MGINQGASPPASKPPRMTPFFVLTFFASLFHLLLLLLPDLAPLWLYHLGAHENPGSV